MGTVLTVAGAAIVLASSMIAGLRIERLAAAYVRVPYGTGAAAGLLVGAVIVARWAIG